MNPGREPSDNTKKATVLSQIHIDKERCKGCGYCVEFCPRDVLKMSDELNPKGYPLPVVEDETKCTACDYCVLLCPEFAIKISKPPTSRTLSQTSP
jgi:2-oxoglutarate ferredoxin oxidoreductase subunit delta